jgi:hypothetical protein
MARLLPGPVTSQAITGSGPEAMRPRPAGVAVGAKLGANAFQEPPSPAHDEAVAFSASRQAPCALRARYQFVDEAAGGRRRDRNVGPVRVQNPQLNRTARCARRAADSTRPAPRSVRQR